MILIQLIVCGLAGWRSASLLVKEEGPWNIFGNIREIIGLRPRVEIKGLLPKIFSCVWCMSCWVTPIFWGLWYLSPIIPGVMAAMAIAVMVEQWVRPVK